MAEFESAAKDAPRRGKRLRWLAGAALLTGALAIVAIGTALAAGPAGPRLAFVEFRAKPARIDLKTGSADQTQLLRLAGGSPADSPIPTFEAPSWSADGEMLTFAAVDTSEKRRLYVVSADGSNLRPLPDTEEARAPILSPDGRSVAFYRDDEKTRTKKGKVVVVAVSSAIWIADLASGSTTPLTRSKKGLEMYPDSFSPDGRRLLVTRVKHKGATPEVVALRLNGGGSKPLAFNATGGVYSPDGTRIVFVRPRVKPVKDKKGKPTGALSVTSNLYTMRADGSERRKLTRSRGKYEIWPSWDPSGQRIAFVSNSSSKKKGVTHASILQINADGTCGSKLYARKGRAYYGAAWQPGAGREAGPIVC